MVLPLGRHRFPFVASERCAWSVQHIRDWLLLRMRSPTSDDDDDDSHGSKAQVEIEETKLGNELGHNMGHKRMIGCINDGAGFVVGR